MLEVNDLHVRVGDREILHGIDLSVGEGRSARHYGAQWVRQKYAGPASAGRDTYEITEGSVTYQSKDLLAMKPEERAREGLFLAFQYPVAIPGISNMYFLRAALNATRKHRGLAELDPIDFLAMLRTKAKRLQIDPALFEPPGQRWLLRRREKTQRDPANGRARTGPGHPR